MREVEVTRPNSWEVDHVDLSRAPGTPQIMASLNHTRAAFTANRKVGIERNLTRGKRLDGAHLQRLVTGDDRIFAARSQPKKRDWFVTIGCDMSGSTDGGLDFEIACGAFAVAELLQAMGIRFALYGHTGRVSDGHQYKYGPSTVRPGAMCHTADSICLQILEAKKPTDLWDEAAKRRCLAFTAQGANVDGHTLEFYRRVTAQQRATDKLILYFTDGAMPQFNFDEELPVLQRNIVACKREGIKLVGVGVGTDSPREHGLDTILYNGIGDLPLLIKGLAERISD